MDFKLTKEQSLMQRKARDFAASRLKPIAKEIECNNLVPEAIYEEMAELELLGLPFDKSYGGANAGYDCYVLALEQIARISAGTAMTLSAHSLALGAIDKFGTMFAKEAALAKMLVAEMAVDAARIAVDIHGSYGVMNDSEISILYRNAIMGPQVEGVADMQKLIIAGTVLA